MEDEPAALSIPTGLLARMGGIDHSGRLERETKGVVAQPSCLQVVDEQGLGLPQAQLCEARWLGALAGGLARQRPPGEVGDDLEALGGVRLAEDVEVQVLE